MIIEGKNAVRELLTSNRTVDKVYILKSMPTKGEFISLSKNKGVRYVLSDKHLLDKMSTNKRHQGVIAIASDFKYSTIDEIKNHAKTLNEDLFLLILDSIEDPHNFGSIIRTAECVGVHGIIISKNNQVQVNETVVKVSAGAISHIHIARVTNINYFIDELKKDFINIVATDMDGDNIFTTKVQKPLALIIGNEGKGIKALTKRKADYILSIPQYGKINSLNASVACALSLYALKNN